MKRFKLSSNWLEDYNRKLVSAEEAVKVVKSHDRVFITAFGGDPYTLLNALAKRKDELEAVEICSCNPVLPLEHSKPEYEGIFIDNPYFVGAGNREAVMAGRGTYTSVSFSNYERFIKDGPIKTNVGMLKVSPPDRFGYMSFGTMVAHSRAVVEAADIVILLVTDQQPRTHGDSFVHISEVDYIVESDESIPTLPEPVSTDKDIAMAEQIVNEIEDGCTLQLGVGGLPNTVGRLLVNKRDLGIHTEMMVDGIMDLLEAGAITNLKKTMHPGKMVFTFAGGSRKLYDWMDDNPLVECHPVAYTNDPYIIGQQYKQVSINATLEVDLTGQACSESIGTRQYSGMGGQLDFVRGAMLSPGGKSFLVVSSTAKTKEGLVSCIVPTLKPGAGVTTPRAEIEYVVTEYGMVNLRGKSTRQRALDLIEIAHPDFRAELRKEAKRLLFIP
ncbi:4-hydroxybutyrate CoA-transferase [Clostridia bacterium]|nr:4-hydroxybutyrate CoA-transferase [Clostridia bacterium]